MIDIEKFKKDAINSGVDEKQLENVRDTLYELAEIITNNFIEEVKNGKKL